MTAESTVARLAAHCRMEQLLFSTLGAWAPSIEDSAARIAAVELSDHAAWRARRWYELLPTAPPGPDAFLVATEAELELSGLIIEAGGSSDAGRFGIVVGELLPTMVGSLQVHLAEAPEVSQRPIRRILEIAIADLERDLGLGLGILERVAGDAGSRAASDLARGRVAAALARSGGPRRV